ncbi:formimidoylglutamase [Winogradskyella immobilis]|uniref:Formimidoylglutamase n=1 Tax=Winogradskyella immobilis TaxID=2816852 RepID=A0ABS8ELS2_9FLAO|nr:formimidoylglutamase [Winogradskyella immobilis]MCC1484164.1 formimidoylglutamase [Winogradskyella immobilis]MCG0016256.1 formimidoylglutamase [Winogradskyella immobilis]
MQNLILFTDNDRDTQLTVRKGESKFGEHVQLINNLTNIYDDIVNLDVDYVIFGVSEDIGVYANYGKTGTYKAWEATIKVLLNIQSNAFTHANRVLILGHLDYSEQRETITALDKTKKQNINRARKFVETIDADVSHLVYSIIKAGKKPIIIGGGHNNAYGNLKGTALALNSSINAINFDAHTDLRTEEGRHSGNGFSYAISEGFLKNYFVFGLHENYTSSTIFKHLNDKEQLDYCTYEALEVRKEIKFKSALNNALKHVTNSGFGIEIDCDAIENIPSSAKTPSGFSTKQARQFINYFGKESHAKYLHICEASPTKKTASKIGKLIMYLITDFIRANSL